MNFVSLYSGCGGVDLGFHNQGFNNIGSFDINDNALAVLKANLKTDVHKTDLTSADVSKIIGYKTVDVVFSGAPCQGFSIAGNRIYSDPRNSLLVKGGEIALQLNTKVFVSENVMGSLVGKHKEYWDQLNLLFIESGYKTKFIKVNCLDIGMAQMRKRVLFFAWNTSKDLIKWPGPIKPKVLGDVLNDLDDKPNSIGYSISENDTKMNIIKKIGNFQKLSNIRGGSRSVATWEIPEVFGNVEQKEKEILIALRNLRRKNRVRGFGEADAVDISFLIDQFGSDVAKSLEDLINKGYVKQKASDKYDLTRTFNGKYRRLSFDEPCPTVDTRFGNPIYFLHPLEHRGFTVREAARIQGFPDEFIFSGSLIEQFKMIGNAVPPPLSKRIAKTVKENLL